MAKFYQVTIYLKGNVDCSIVRTDEWLMEAGALCELNPTRSTWLALLKEL